MFSTLSKWSWIRQIYRRHSWHMRLANRAHIATKFIGTDETPHLSSDIWNRPSVCPFCEQLVLSIVRGPPRKTLASKSPPRSSGRRCRGTRGLSLTHDSLGGSPRCPVCDSALSLNVTRSPSALDRKLTDGWRKQHPLSDIANREARATWTRQITDHESDDER